MNITCIAIDCVGESYQCKLTTEHSASSYGVPVIVRTMRLVDYGDVQTLWLVSDVDTEQHVDFRTHAQLDMLLSPFGIEVKRFVP